MQKIINQILEGNFDYANGSLDFSCSKIEISLRRGEQYEGSFSIYAAQGTYANGTVISSDLRMECLTEEFVGSGEEISFRFHGETLEEGDVVKGSFYIVSNQGEYYIPFVVTVEYKAVESSVGTIKNLFHFANLAKSNWQEAVKLYYSPEFARILSGRDTQYADDYRALSAYEGMEQSVEEFLVQVNKKQKVEFLLEEQELILELGTEYNAGSVVECELNIIRNGWGFTRLFIECRGDFLFTEKEVLTDDDFLGNRCRLPVFLDGSLCRKGKNYGEICLYNCYVTLIVPVAVSSGSNISMGKPQLDQKRITAQLMEHYLAFRMKKISTATWLKESGALVERLVTRNENDAAARLFQAQMLITEERVNEAGWILDHVSELLEQGAGDSTLTAYYLYLTTLIHREEEYVNRVTAKVEQIYRKDSSDWWAAWLLLYLSQDYHKSVPGKWAFLEKQFEDGCSSPVLYIEAITMINNNPALLRKLGAFELQVLWYGTRQDILRPETEEQLLYLTGKAREFHPVLYRILVKLYGRRSDVRILQEICTLLIKGARTDNRYFEWYKAGVNAKLRITNLFEYYMMSLDLNVNQELPKTVLMYFSYQNNLDYERSAYLYDYIVQRADKLGEIYEVYRPRIEQFVLEQIKKEHINRPLANLYNRLLEPGMINEETCGPLSKLLFSHFIRVEDHRLQKVYVYQPGNLYPAEYTLNDCQTWVALYGNNYTIVFEDAWKNRFIRTVEYTLEKLMLQGKHLRLMMPYLQQSTELDIFLCENDKEDKENPSENIRRALRVLDSGCAQPHIRRELYLRVLQYYYDVDDMRSLDEYLTQIPSEDLTAEDRDHVIHYMVLRGRYELARAWLEKYGPYFVDAKVLVRLISPLMKKVNMVEDPILTASAIYAFNREKYDGTVLEYLSMYYRGMTKNMRDIWKAARAFGVDCYRLSEAILIQMLYSGAFVGEKMDIFHYYVSQGAKPEVEEAFLSQCAFDYFVRERITESDVFKEIQHMYLRGEPVQRVCRLALLKYYAENIGGLGEDAQWLVEQFLRELMAEGIHLNIFKEFKGISWVQQELADKTIVEYRAAQGSRACIHYVITREDGGSDEYISEYMREVYGGVCFKEFILFFGESLQYYITEERGEESQLTESGTLQMNDSHSLGDDSRYRLVNDIVISRTLEDMDTMDDLLEEYYRKDYMNGRLFRLK
ncbi:MAG: hypothetical protein J1E01_08350 [Acetatifactor sp.]|nr:hypothetical protein [Acetatifactor sp.]